MEGFEAELVHLRERLLKTIDKSFVRFPRRDSVASGDAKPEYTGRCSMEAAATAPVGGCRTRVGESSARSPQKAAAQRRQELKSPAASKASGAGETSNFEERIKEQRGHVMRHLMQKAS